MTLRAIILAAGHGTRMKSRLSKVLHPLAGKPMLLWSVEACQEATGFQSIVVIGPEADDIHAMVGDRVQFAVQAERLGTGHATQQAVNSLPTEVDQILVTNADLPLLSSESYTQLILAHQQGGSSVSMLTAVSENPRGFGRVMRSEAGEISGIIEAAHATPEQLAIQELNVGAYIFEVKWLKENIADLPLSPKGEYYLTDLIGMAVDQDLVVSSAQIEGDHEIIGVNTRIHLAEAEVAIRRQISEKWMLEGVTLHDPGSIYIDSQVELGQDTAILPNTHLQGATQIGSGSVIGPNCIVRDSIIGEDCRIENSVLEGAVLEDRVDVGPYAHLRQGAHLGQGVHIGNFGEIKNSRLDAGVKMGHFSYIGDADIGAEVNIGAGTITCNFDGEKKHKTEIGSGAFIGSDTMLVAPLRIGRNARTGAGAVVTKDVPDDSVAVGMPARVVRKLKDRD
jgi:bifunctional UDP-N-acetylglucosamine pyrophosphorylase/glucosamine-1-phosphate N-acetyltransferase